MQINITDSTLELEQNGENIAVDWANIRSISYPLFGSYPVVRTQSQGKLILRGTEQELGQVIPEIFAAWMKQNPHLAKKMAFDYAEPPKQGAWLLICLATLFCFVLSGMLWVETATQYSCTRALKAAPIFDQNPEIIKLKKKQRGNFQVTLRFTAENGQVLEGKRLTLETYKMGNDPSKFSVVYGKGKPYCWVLSENPDEIDINWARRRYLTAFDFFVGLCFFITGVVALYAGVRRLREKRPGREDIISSMDVNLS